MDWHIELYIVYFIIVDDYDLPLKRTKNSLCAKRKMLHNTIEILFYFFYRNVVIVYYSLHNNREKYWLDSSSEESDYAVCTMMVR